MITGRSTSFRDFRGLCRLGRYRVGNGAPNRAGTFALGASFVAAISN